MTLNSRKISFFVMGYLAESLRNQRPSHDQRASGPAVLPALRYHTVIHKQHALVTP